MTESDENRDPAVAVRMPRDMLEDLEGLRPPLNQLPAGAVRTGLS